MAEKKIEIEPSWYELMKEEFQKDYFKSLISFLRKEKQCNKVIYPPGNQIFEAFNRTPVSAVKVVVLGQDPYHNPGEAMGLCFSVNKGVKIPPSLLNIYKELNRDIGIAIPDHGLLVDWADQGVLLLNAMLTVEKNKAGSHKNIGWQDWTDSVIRKISENRENLVFMLWGNFAKSKKPLINTKKHLVLESVHPSPLAGNRFLGNGHFSAANNYLISKGISPIDWTIK
ncbi:MAG TPA: uracil-DNA glycosylase [Saprospiraceae bacterium]|nr:uracil-DNA glycosylase [Saprospiraceae bacterium]MCB9327390.1 uracil-DNA glycosylase [Lewinellaceae bacterium]HPK10464.1 uracil-DNA glycosylase [Saprospiraceae bacterium]HPQ20718.1 uracil-DNA glycosylase [Saprospiraceae bacterium]HRX29442.1 uracil-DNA glycosylase [Saprospiraceae bacterium]